jgi:hypothetical protein
LVSQVGLRLRQPGKAGSDIKQLQQVMAGSCRRPVAGHFGWRKAAALQMEWLFKLQGS